MQQSSIAPPRPAAPRRLILRLHPPERLTVRLQAVEATTIEKLRRVSLPMLRLAIGLVFVWFGALKIAGNSPVNDFVARTLPWFDRGWVIPALGWFEITIGLLLISGRFLSLVCVLLVGHLVGTFLSLIMQPSVTFQDGNPLMLTTEGEFVVKNIVFIAAALVIAARFHNQDMASLNRDLAIIPQEADVVVTAEEVDELR